MSGLNQEPLPCCFCDFRSFERYPSIVEHCVPPLPFCSACTLEFPINLIDLTITEPVVHGIPESINNLPFTASSQ